jgi:glycosyltransferase involved in cell wall biosynthesis
MNEQPRTRKLRVVTLSATFSASGGAERVATELVKRLDANRFDRIACSTRWRGKPSLYDDLAAAGVRILALDRRSRWDLGAWRPLISLLRQERVDVLHSHASSNFWGAILGRLTGVPVVVAHEHTGRWDDGSIGQRLQRRVIGRHVVARGADVLLAVSHDVRRRLVEHAGIGPESVRVLPNGIAFPSGVSGQDLRHELGIPLDAPLVGTVCVIRPEKALDVLVESVAVLTPRFPGLKVLIAGHGPEEERLQGLIKQKGLEQTMLLLGRRSDVPRILAALDVAVSTSDWEGMPISVLEYMAAGRPVVATRVGGTPDLIDDGVEGFLVEPRDVKGLAEALARLLRDQPLREQMGLRARDRQRRDFDIDQVVRRLEDLYEELFEMSNRGRREGWAPPSRTASAQRAPG